MKLTIKQPTTSSESTGSAVVEKLYNLAFEDPQTGISQLDNASDVIGNITVPGAYEDSVKYLTGDGPGERNRFELLTITMQNNEYYRRFTDPVFFQYCIENYSSDGVGIIPSDVLNRTKLFSVYPEVPSQLLNITSLDDFKYFTGALATSLIYKQGDNLPTTVLFPYLTSITFPSKNFSGTGNGFQYLMRNVPNLLHIDYNGATFGVSSSSISVYCVIWANNGISLWSDSLIPNQTNFERVSLFRQWSSLPKVIFPEGVTHICEEFYGCTSLTYMEFPSTTIDMGKTGYGFRRNCNGNMDAVLVIKAPTPPSWRGYRSDEDGISRLYSERGLGWELFNKLSIYVPDDAYNAYISVASNGLTDGSDSVWASNYVKGRINKLSTLGNVYIEMGSEGLQDFINAHNPNYVAPSDGE